MKVPQLRKKPEVKSCHNTSWEDNYSWIHQANILDGNVLSNPTGYMESLTDLFIK